MKKVGHLVCGEVGSDLMVAKARKMKIEYIQPNNGSMFD